MRKLGLILLFGIATLPLFAQSPDLFLTDKIALNDRSISLKKIAFIESKNYGLTDFIYQRMEWEINPNVLYIDGVVTTHFKSKIENLNEIEFDLDSFLKVDSVTHNHTSIPFNRTQNKIIIPLNESILENQIDSVSIYYHGIPNETGFGSFSKTMHGGVPIIWTLSEPYGAMEWWPCKQSLVDKVDSIDIIVTSPVSFRTASIGKLVSEIVNEGKRKMHWKHRFPIATYLVAIAVTNYSNYSDILELQDGRKIEILNYVYPENLENAKLKTPHTIELMELFNELIGEYPFADEKYGHAQFGWGGGMEHQTMSFMGNFEFGLISHELAHQWFGDCITLGSWQDIWLNEGFASYLTGLSYEHLLEGVWWDNWKKVNVEKITSQPDGSVFVQDTTNINTLFSSRLSYSKGAYLLHMLRWIVGDDDFYKGMKSYFYDPLINNGYARTYQFVEHLENSADTSLTEFFNDWFYGEGFPIYSAQFMQEETNKLKIILSQTSSHSSVDFFEMPVPIRLYNSDQTDSIDFRLNNNVNDQEFNVNPGFQVTDLKIDPDNWLVSKIDAIVYSPNILNPEVLLVYPNPFSENLTISLPPNQILNSIKLFSQKGKPVLEYFGNNRSFNWSHIPSGIYIIHVETSSGKYLKKIVKN